MIIEVGGEGIKLPDFLLIGAAKSGTTSLYHYLRQHPQIFLPRQKEPLFFSFQERPPQCRDTDLRGNRGKNIVWRFEEYVKLFQKAKEDQTVGEASTSYLYTSDTTIEHIKSVYGEKYRDIKIMVILRNPVERAYSHYLFLTKLGWETLPFEQAICERVMKERFSKFKGYEYVDHGMYYRRIQSYLDEFPNVKINLFDDLKDPKKLVRDMFEFLGVNPHVHVDTDFVVNPSGIPKSRLLVDVLLRMNSLMKPVIPLIPLKYSLRLIELRDGILKRILEKPQMRDATRSKLLRLFRGDVLRLQGLIGRDLSHWMNVKNET